MTLIKRAWSVIPDGATKDWLRLVANNFTQRGSAHFRRENGIYVAEIEGCRLATIDPPFGYRRVLHQFESRHPVLAGEVVVDAGAFKGVLMNLFAAQVGPSGRVLAFEPDSVNRERALRNWKVNGSPAQVELISLGLWDCQAEIEFCERGALGSSAFWDGPGGHKVKVRTTTLDQVVSERKLGRVDFVKMNIEGAEIKALQGASETIRRFRPHFAISSDHHIDGNIGAEEKTCGPVEYILREHGYVAETVRYGTEWVTYGTPQV